MALQLAVIAVVLIIASTAFARTGQTALEEQYGLRAQAIAESVAEIPEVRDLVGETPPAPELQGIAERIRLRTGVSFVVITDVEGIRQSHPNPERIGKRVSTDPSIALSGISDWYIQTGTLGPSVRGKVPIWDQSGEEVVGIVSVGVLTGEVSDTLRDQLGGLLLAAAIAFGAGAAAAYIGARRIRRQTLGLEPPEIAAMYEHRDGMLRSLHEGVVAIDEEDIVTLMNDEAAMLLGLDSSYVGHRLDEHSELSELLGLAVREERQVDVALQIRDRSLLVTVTPMMIRSRKRGAVYTLRDRTELRGLVTELETAQELVEALRAQAHEHSNNLHTISGLIELDRHQDVLEVIRDHSASQRALTQLYAGHTGGESLVAATLLAKSAIATERGIQIRTRLGDLPQTAISFSRDLVTIIGNIVQNSIEHLSESGAHGGGIEVDLWMENDAIQIEISDSGSGIPQDLLPSVFDSGFTTKDRRTHDGLGLALVRELVDRRGGTITVESEVGEGTLFTVQLPLPVTPQEAAHV
ncbi:MAG: ATP-binding protein [Acidimicrobiales bacterium]